jgi:glyoxylase-like metal-dependent hydrolase (beta-lactamase superfamily II)
VLVRGFPAQAFDTNCYVVAPGQGEQCVVVDPGIGVEQQLDELLREFDLQPVAVLLTHGHLDHTFSVTPVCGARGIPAYISSQDRDQLRDPAKYLSPQTGQIFGGRLQWTEPDDVKLLDPTDLPGGSWEEMQASLRDVILPMADDTIVLPGHGGATTIGRERQTNPFLQDLPPVPPSRGL